ncbi:flavin reductase [Paracoccus sp. M683]|uniref:flavin reductase family protein n=1 Tax=Paracoccus sp. M683 TaxID=2594268 RepID=UPI00117D641F|nr:flavin reductase family protein [Paracoccus sp. M683]TRW95323.1 flavin reductase [Paracoccus sp. M683]
MRLYLGLSGAITLIEPVDFRRLDVLIDPQINGRLDPAIARIGHRDGDQHVWLCPQILRFLSGHAGEADWEAGFGGMLAYAAKAGWVNGEGMVRAHLTWVENREMVSHDDFKAAMRALPAGIAAITTLGGGEPAALIVSSLTSISADPPMVGFFINEKSPMAGHLLETQKFVANILGHEHARLVQTVLSQPQGNARFAGGSWAAGYGDIPVLQDAVASMECDIVHNWRLGTHRLFVGLIRHAASRTGANPLVNFGAEIRSLQAGDGA